MKTFCAQRMHGSKCCFESRRSFLQGLYRVLNSWNLPSNFPNLEKVWKIEVKSWKNGKKSWFFFWKVTTSASQEKFFSHVCQILFNLTCMSLKKLCSHVFLRSLLRRQHGRVVSNHSQSGSPRFESLPGDSLALFLAVSSSNPWPCL